MNDNNDEGKDNNEFVVCVRILSNNHFFKTTILKLLKY